MKKNQGNFALGLTLGICGTLLFLLYVSQAFEACSSSSNIELTKSQTSWCSWNGLIESRDTLAQWFMTIFTVIAAWLLFQTLRVTQEMADDTRTLGRDQTRAYLNVDRATIYCLGASGKFKGTKRKEVFGIVLEVKNGGTTPCEWYEVRGAIQVAERTLEGPKILREVQIISRRWRGIAPKGTSSFQLRVEGDEIQSAIHEVASLQNGLLRFSGILSYETVFSEIREVVTEYFVDAHEIKSAYLISDLGKPSDVREWKLKMYQSMWREIDP